VSDLSRQLLFLSDVRYGGWVTFSWHLMRLLGKPSVLRIANTLRGGGIFYDTARYRNITPHVAQQLPDPIVLAVGKQYRTLLKHLQPGYLVIHDPTELCDEVREYARRATVITIRQSVSDLLYAEGITNLCLRHPFYKFERKAGAQRKDRALSRIDWDKNTDLILQANALGADVAIHGQVNRIYEHHGDLAQYNFRQYYKGPYSRDMKEVSRLYNSTRNLVDMSVIKNDGGGTQYTFLEAEYHGCGLILHRGWTDVPNSVWKPGKNCRAVSTPDELVDALAAEPICSNLMPTAAMNRQWVTLLKRKTSR